MLTNLDAFRDNHTTPCAGLTCVLGIHGNDLRTSFFDFVRKELSEHAQTRIMCREGKITACHKRQVQIFNNNCAVGVNEFGRGLVPEVFALIGDMFVKLCNLLDGLAPSGAKLLLAGKLAIQDSLSFQRVAQPTGIVKPFAITQGGKAKHTNVKPNGLTCVRFRLRVGELNLKVSVPIADVLFDDDLLDNDIVGQRTVQAHLDIADVLNVESVTVKLAAVAVAILQRLKAVTPLETRQSANALVKSFVGLVETTKHLLNRSHVEQPHIFWAVVPLNLDALPLVGITDRLARTLPQPTTLVECIVIDGLHLEQNVVKGVALLRGRRKPILVSQNQFCSSM